MNGIAGLANRGDWHALERIMQRAGRGERLTLGFLGGSITQGSLASAPDTCYAYLVYDWWRKTFPQASFSFVNGGIGGTSSHFAGARVWEDVLCYRPDVVVVDFSVNDTADPFFEETYEGVIRRLLKAPSKPAVIIMNNVFYDNGCNAQEYHNRIGAYYGLPCVSMKDAIYPKIESGQLKREDITPDNLHPNDCGHRLVADVICSFLKAVRLAGESGTHEPADCVSDTLPAPLTANAYEDSRRIQLQDDAAVLEGFRTDTEEKKGMLDIFKNGWMADRVNDKIIFEINCSCLAVQYRKSVLQPVPAAVAVIDGDEEHGVVLDGNFRETWGDCLYLQPLLHHAEKKIHRLEIRIAQADRPVRPFYLVSVIASGAE